MSVNARTRSRLSARAFVATAVVFTLSLVPIFGPEGGGGGDDHDRGSPAAGPPPRVGELPERRTATSTTRRHADGSMTTTVYGAPVNYRAPDGSLQPIDSTLRATEAGGFAWRNGANAFDLFFKEAAGAGFAEFRVAGRRFRLDAEGAKAGTPARVTGGQIVYPGAYDGADLRYSLDALGVQKVIDLAGPDSPSEYAFRLSALGEGPAPTVQRRPDGSYAVNVAPLAGPAFVLAAPTVREAAGDREVAPAAHDAKPRLSVRQQGRDLLVTLGLDREWLRAPGRRFPVQLDPTITIQPDVEDASFVNKAGFLPFVSDRLFIGTTDAGWRAALRFDLAAVPPAVQVTNAQLGLYFDGVCIAVSGVPFCGGTSHQMDAHRLTSAWTTSSTFDRLTMDPAVAGTFTLPATLPGGWMSWPITATVTGWLDGTLANHGLIVKRRTEPVNMSGPVPPGKRFTGTPALQPKLDITYLSDAVDLLDPTTLHSNGAELAWTQYTGPSGAPFDRYEVHRGTSSTFQPSSATLLTTIRDKTITAYRDTTAAPDKDFTYRIVANTAVSNARTVRLPAAGLASKFLQPGPVEGRHTYLYYSTNLTNCVNYGAHTGAWVGSTTDARYRNVIAFDLKGIPPGASISEAKMSLWQSQGSAVPLTVEAHRITRPWKEGTDTAIACTGSGATWYETEGGQSWTTAGGDFDPAVAAQVSVPAGQPYQFHDFTITGLVQSWVNGVPNNGVLLKTTSEALTAGNNVIYNTDDFATSPALRPKLTVLYADGSAPQGPNVSLAAPGPGSVVSGSSVRLAASAEDDRRVERVDFLVNGAKVGEDFSAPFEMIWDSTTVGNGSKTITVTGVDDAGNVKTLSPGVQVTVDNTAPPFGTLSAPASNATVWDKTTLSATASDDTGVASVAFLVDGVRVGAPVTTAPYSLVWDTKDPLARIVNGAHELRALVTDVSGQTFLSAPRTVNVDNLGGTPSEAEITLNDPASTVDDVFPAAMAANTAAGVPVQDPYFSTVVNPDGTSSGSLNRALKDPPQNNGGTPSGACPANAYCPTVNVTNRSSTTWRDSTAQVWYRWYAPNGAVMFEGRSTAAFPSTYSKNETASFPLRIYPPALPPGLEQGTFRLRVDIWDPATNTWFAARGNASLDNPIIVAKSLATKLGLERFYQYEAEPVGAGMSTLTNVANGNMLLRWTPFFAPGRGLSTMVDLTYNSLEDHSKSPVGNNFSLSISGLARLGEPIDIHPNKADEISGQSNKWVDVTDGDGTVHRFTGTTGTDGVTRWQEPPGVNLYLRSLAVGDPKGRWAMARPDKVTFYFDVDGFPTLVEDRNGNRITFVLEETPAGEDPGGPKKRVIAVTDPAGRSFTIDYWSKDEAKKAHVRGKIQTIRDFDGSRLDFDYYDDGNLLRLTQRGGTNANGSFLADRSFVFTYTTSNGAGAASADLLNPNPRTPNQSTRVHSVADPRRNLTTFAYYLANEDPQLRWKLKSRTNRLGKLTGLGYDLTTRVTTVTAPLARVNKYTYDTTGKVTRILNPLNEPTDVEWTPDFKVSKVTEPTGRFSEYGYNANGYLTRQTNQAGETTVLEYLDQPVDGNDTGNHLSLLKFATKPKGVVTTGDPTDFRWQFTHDIAGNVDRIIDPTGAATDYDYHLAGTPNAGTVSQIKDANGNAPTVFEGYDPSGQPTRVKDPSGRITQFGYTADGRTQWIQDPGHSGETASDVRAYRVYFDYDAFGRLGRQSAPKSTRTDRGNLLWSSVGYDANDNIVRTMDAHYGPTTGDPETGAVTTTTYDAMDRSRLVTRPDTSADPAGERTETEYDDAGRVSRFTRPKGVRSATTVNDYATLYTYDGLDRVTRQTEYGADTSAGQTRVTQVCYDLAGDVRSVTSPRAWPTVITCPGTGPANAAFTTETDYDPAHRPIVQRDDLGHATRTDYDLNGNLELQERDIDLGRMARQQLLYNARDQIVETRERFDGAAGRELITKMEYDPNGNLTKRISPRAYDAANGATPTFYVTVNRYDSLNRLAKVELPFDGRDGTERQFVHNWYDANGNVMATSLPVTSSDPNVVGATAKTQMEYFDTGWIRTSDDPANPKVHFDYTALGRQSSRQAELRSAPGTLDPDDRMFWEYYVDGMLKNRTDRQSQLSRYEYDEHNNLVRGFDNASTDPSEKEVQTQARYTGFDEPDKVRHRKADVAAWTFTDYDYDANGNVSRRLENGKETGNDINGPVTRTVEPRQFQLTYDSADWLDVQLDLGTDSACKNDSRTKTTYFGTGWEKSREIRRAGDGCTATSTTWPVKQTTTWAHFDNGKLRTLVTKNGAGAVTESHDVSYVDVNNDYVNGNRTRDRYILERENVSGLNGATTCEGTAVCEAQFEYDARDRLIRHQQRVGKQTTYKLDEPIRLIGDTTVRAGNVTTEVTGTLTTTRRYTGMQLTETTVGTSTAKYWYDPFGNTDCITTSAGTAANCSPPTGGTASNLLVDYAYDYLRRLVSTGMYSGATRTDYTTYTYDALDRVSKEIEDHGGTGNDRRTDFTYQGVSGLVTEEKQTGGTNRTKTYSYDAYGHRITMSDRATGGTGTDEQHFTYGNDVHGSISQLLDTAGKVKASYGYTAYGASDAPSTDTQSLTTGDTNNQAPFNPFRYTGKRMDSGTANSPTATAGYQMGARRFGPDFGRFLQQDMFAGALANLGLALDPLTQNRYALAGGNPISFIETDGHMMTADGGGGGSTYATPPPPPPPSDDDEPGLLERGLDLAGDALEWGGDRAGDLREWGEDRLGDAREWGEDRLTDAINFGGEVWDRGSTLAVYHFDAFVRRATNPVQTAKDVVLSGGLLPIAESAAATEAIVAGDAELKRDGPYCRREAECLTGASVPGGADAITIGHSIRFSSDNPTADLVGHEMQHVYDIENVGGIPFYGSYLADYVGGRVRGMSHDQAYRSVYWEERAYYVQDHYYQGVRPRGWPW